MHELKYSEELDDKNCQISKDKFKERRRKSFRFVRSNILNEKNFLPVNILNSKRDVGCKGYALSFYTTKEYAEKKYYTLINNKPKLRKKLGTHLATGIIEKSYGISDEATSKGHFDHFEYRNIDLNNSFNIVCELNNSANENE